MSIVSGTYAAKAQAKGNKLTRKSAKETNSTNLALFREGRGSKGSALFPTYAKPFEKDFYNSVSEGFKAPARNIGEFRDASAGFRSSQDAANATAAGIFDGSMTNKLLANAKPVQEARVGYRRQASIDALNKSLSEITAAQANRGFVGDSSAAQALKFNAQKTAADEVAAENLRNIEEIRAIRDRGDVEMPLASLDLPGRMAANEMAMISAPDNAYTDALSRRLALTNALRIGPGSFQTQQLPAYNGGMGVGGAIASGAGQIASAYLNYKNQADAAAALAKLGATSGYSAAAGTAAGNAAVANAAAASATPSYLSAAGIGY